MSFYSHSDSEPIASRHHQDLAKQYISYPDPSDSSKILSL